MSVRRMIWLAMVLLMACMFAPAVAESEFEGVWVYSEDYETASYTGDVTAYMDKYPYAEYEMRIEGNKCVIRAHQNYAEPFTLSLKKKTGWYEAGGNLNGDSMWMVGVKYTLARDGAALTITNTETGTMLTFEKDADGLAFDAEQLQGSWQYDYNIKPDTFDAVYSVIYDENSGLTVPDRKLQAEDADIYISGDRVTLVQQHNSGYDGDLFPADGPYALDAEQVEYKESGMYATIGGFQVKIYVDQQGVLHLAPVFGDNVYPSYYGSLFYPMGDEQFGYRKMAINVYDSEPVAEDMKAYVGTIRKNVYEMTEDEKAGLTELMKKFGIVSIMQDGTASLTVDGEVYTGALTMPDPYTCNNKEDSFMFSCGHDGFTLALARAVRNTDLESGVFLNVYAGDKYLASFALELIDDENGIVGSYKALTGEQSTLTVDENMTVTQVINGETYTGGTEIRFTEYGYTVFGVELNGVFYELIIEHFDELTALARKTDENGLVKDGDISISYEKTVSNIQESSAGGTTVYEACHGISYDSTKEDWEIAEALELLNYCRLTINEDWTEAMLRTGDEYTRYTYHDLTVTRTTLVNGLSVLGFEFDGWVGEFMITGGQCTLDINGFWLLMEPVEAD